MAEDPLVRQAWALYKQGRFSAALESLEPKVFQHRQNPSFYRIMGLCCLRLGDWNGGETYLQRSLQLDERPHQDTLLALMAVEARRKNYSEAVRYGLRILDQDPSHKRAQNGLERLRVALSGPEDAPGLDKDVLGRWLPPYRKIDPRVKLWSIRLLLVIAVAGGLVGGTWWGLSLVQGSKPAVPVRSGPGDGPIDPSQAIQTGQGFAITLTAEEVKSGWDRAQRAFQAYQDSRARYEINRLLLSNAAAGVKERARGLIPFLHDPDFARPEDSSTYQEVRVAPALYEGCTVRWTGVVANLISGERKITFDLLLGYQDGQVVEGIVPVELGFAALLKNSQVVEILGRVLLRDGRWLVQGTSLHEQGYRAP